MYVCVYICVHVNVCVHLCVCACVCVQVRRCVYVCMCLLVCMYLCAGQKTTWGSWFSFHPVNPLDWTQVPRLGSKLLYLWALLTAFLLTFVYEADTPLGFYPGAHRDECLVWAQENTHQSKQLSSRDPPPQSLNCTLVLCPLAWLTQVCPCRYAGPMERAGAEGTLINRSDGTYLVRQRVKDTAEFAISIK